MYPKKLCRKAIFFFYISHTEYLKRSQSLFIMTPAQASFLIHIENTCTALVSTFSSRLQNWLNLDAAVLKTQNTNLVIFIFLIKN